MSVKFIAVILAYAAALMTIGFFTAEVAPPSSKSGTSQIAAFGSAGIMIACAVMSLLVNVNRKVGMIGIHLAIVMPLLVAAAPGIRLGLTLADTAEFNEQLGKLQDAVTPDEQDDGDAASRVVNLSLGVGGGEDGETVLNARAAGELLWQSDLGSGWRPKGYAAMSLVSVLGLSIFAFVALVSHRPKVPAKEKPAVRSESRSEGG